jgi:hypothetical protein
MEGRRGVSTANCAGRSGIVEGEKRGREDEEEEEEEEGREWLGSSRRGRRDDDDGLRQEKQRTEADGVHLEGTYSFIGGYF